MVLYQITHNDDDNAGAGRTVFMNLYFTSKSDAKTFVESKFYADSYGVRGFKGNAYDIRHVQSKDIEPKIYSSITDYEEKTGINVDLNIKQNKEKKLENMSKEDLILLIKTKKIY